MTVDQFSIDYLCDADLQLRIRKSSRDMEPLPRSMVLISPDGTLENA